MSRNEPEPPFSIYCPSKRRAAAIPLDSTPLDAQTRLNKDHMKQWLELRLPHRA